MRRERRLVRLHCANWAMMGNSHGFSGGRDVVGWRRALQVAHRFAREAGAPCRLYTRGGRRLLGEVTPSGKVRLLRKSVHWSKGLPALRNARVVS